MPGPSTKGRNPSLKGYGSVNWLKSGDYLKGCDILFLWFRLDFCSLDLDVLCLCRSGKSLVVFSPILPEHHDQVANAMVLCKSDYSDCCFVLLSTILTMLEELIATGLCLLGIQLLPLHSGFPTKWLQLPVYGLA